MTTAPFLRLHAASLPACWRTAWAPHESVFSSGQWWTSSHIIQGVPGEASTLQASSRVSFFIGSSASPSSLDVTSYSFTSFYTPCSVWASQILKFLEKPASLPYLRTVLLTAAWCPAWISEVPRSIQLLFWILRWALSFPHLPGSDLHSLLIFSKHDYLCVCSCIYSLSTY